jgi:hypothetical protein
MANISFAVAATGIEYKSAQITAIATFVFFVEHLDKDRVELIFDWDVVVFDEDVVSKLITVVSKNPRPLPIGHTLIRHIVDYDWRAIIQTGQASQVLRVLLGLVGIFGMGYRNLG